MTLKYTGAILALPVEFTGIKLNTMEILKMFLLVMLQNASFTLVSRARNSNSLIYHGTASVLSNGIWLLVIRKVVTNLDKTELMVTYLIASVVGSISMHYVAMKFFEKPKNESK